MIHLHLPSVVLPLPGDPGTLPAHPVDHVVRTMVVGGMPGWQIALIALGAARVAAAIAIVVDRKLAARRRPASTAS